MIFRAEASGCLTSPLMSYSLVLPVQCLAFGEYRYLQPSTSIFVRACMRAYMRVGACVSVCLSMFMLRCDWSTPDL